MRSALFGLATVILLAATGCEHHNYARNGCSSCDSCGHGGGHGGGLAGHLGSPRPTPVARLPHGYMDDNGPGGPPSATYAYPYYTNRAPRDFLLDNPPSIGN